MKGRPFFFFNRQMRSWRILKLALTKDVATISRCVSNFGRVGDFKVDFLWNF